MDKQLERAVINQLGLSHTDVDELRETLRDIRNNGVGGGFGGFIYHTETVKFAEDNKAVILNVAREMAYDLGLDGAYSMIAGFNCLNDMTTDSVADAIHSPDSEDHTSVMNALAWFAAEEVARSYE